MYLKRLELQGFKSFADKTVLEFMPGITTVIGPNGSGKSNISDAIRWVLGEQSIKSLRGAKSEDIIFAGTQNRKSLGFAEASLVFNNDDGKLPIEYAEVTVTRRIYRTGETGYFINKTPCRLKDILELFMDTGIGKDGYSIIGQGKIDEILSNKSEDRRHIFEEAAGIVKYRSRKEDSEKKLERSKLNLLRINDILSEIENNMEPLKIQSEKAKKFLSLREELKGIEVGLFLYNIDLYKERLEKITADEDIMNSTYENEQKSQEEKNEKKNKLKVEINNLIEEIESMQNIGFESSNQIEKINSNINVSEERINNIQENNKRYETEIAEINDKIVELEEEKKQKIAKKENLFSNKEKFEKELKEKEEELNKLTAKLSDKQLEIENKKKIIEENTDRKYEVQNDINTQDVTTDSVEKNIKAKTEELELTISELDGARLKKSEIEQNFIEIESRRNKLKNDLQKLDIKIKELTEEVNNLSEDTLELEERENVLNKYIVLLNEELFNKRTNLSRLNEEHKSILSELDGINDLKSNKLDEHLVNLMESINNLVKSKEIIEKDIKVISKEKIEVNDEINILDKKLRDNNSSYNLVNNELKNKEVVSGKLEVKLDNLLEELNNSYNLTYESACGNYNLEMDADIAREHVKNLKKELASLGNVNVGAIDEYERISKRYEFLNSQKYDLESASGELKDIIREMDDIMIDKFKNSFDSISKEFSKIFKMMFKGGKGELSLSNPDDLLNTGIDILAIPPGKKINSPLSLSGGEKALTAICLLFAMLEVKPSPFVILDEAEAALDEVNVDMFGKYLSEEKSRSQFIVITHKKRMMEYADSLYGITMQESGVSKIVSAKLES